MSSTPIRTPGRTPGTSPGAASGNTPARASARPGEPPKPDTPVLRVHLWLESEGGMLFGLGRAQLLEMVALLGSLNQAAKALGMSYRAAWGRIKRTEEALGQPLLVKASGRKGYELTPLAAQLVRDFGAWHREVETFALKRARERLPWDVTAFAAAGLKNPGA